MKQSPIVQIFARDRQGHIPNSDLPLVLWRGRLDESDPSGETARALFERNGWTGTWVYTVYPFWHFHTKGHEVLACVSGEAVLGFGGEIGIRVPVKAGDVVLIPAGVGHKRLSATADFRVAGAYPPGQEGDITSPRDLSDDAIAEALGSVALPEKDPVSGEGWSVWPA